MRSTSPACRSRVTFGGSSSLPFRTFRPRAARPLGRRPPPPFRDVPPAGAAAPAARARRRVQAALREDREPARLQHAQLADDAVAAPPPSATARAAPQLVVLDAQRVR